MYLTFDYDIDISKVILMLSIHELSETVIGDLTTFQISKENKESQEQQAFHELLSGINNSKQMEYLFIEFDAKENK